MLETSNTFTCGREKKTTNKRMICVNEMTNLCRNNLTIWHHNVAMCDGIERTDQTTYNFWFYAYYHVLIDIFLFSKHLYQHKVALNNQLFTIASIWNDKTTKSFCSLRVLKDLWWDNFWMIFTGALSVFTFLSETFH